MIVPDAAETVKCLRPKLSPKEAFRNFERNRLVCTGRYWVGNH